LTFLFSFFFSVLAHLQTHPHLAFISNIQEKSYSNAMKNCYEHSSTLYSNPEKSKTFFSLAKLCGKLAAPASSSAAAAPSSVASKPLKPLSFLSPPVSKPVNEPSPEEYQLLSLAIQKELSLLKIQEDILTYLPMISPSAFQQPSSSSSSSSSSNRQFASRSYLLLSTILSFMQTLRQQKNDNVSLSSSIPIPSQEILIKILSEIMTIFEIEPLSQTSKDYQQLCLSLWIEILLWNEEEWLNYAMISLMTKEMEKEMKENCLFYHVNAILSDEWMVRGKERSHGLSSEEEMWFSPVANPKLMEAILKESDLSKKYMNEDGEVCEYQQQPQQQEGKGGKDGQRNERVVNVLSSCLSTIKSDVEEKHT
jgi:hypothetical protein